ncbi:MAG: sulfite exporter TauE/SafE family protein, partial [Spongiibacteraceae bacterium]
MPETLALFSALMLGLMGSTHCIGMCGGISASLGLIDGRRSVSFALSYNLGRIVCYATLGALLGALVALLGKTVHPLLPSIGLWLRVCAGLLVISMGLYISGWWLGLTHIEAAGSALWRRVQPYVKKIGPPRTRLAAAQLGALWGLLPCGLVYSSLGWTAAHGNAVHSAILMATFGVGTLPAMLLTTLGGQQLQHYLRRAGVRKIVGLLLIGFGIATIAMPLLHAGIVPGLHQGHGQGDAHAEHEHHH